MKIKFSLLPASATIVFGLLLSFSVLAQEEGMPLTELQDVNHQELNLNDEDKTLIYEVDSKSGKNIPAESHPNGAQVVVKSKSSDSHKPSATSTPNAKEGDDALSFNFLFYIIQKYKFSDIIDQ